MLIVESRVDSPILREALGRVPGMQVVHEEQYLKEDGTVRLFVWASGGDFSAFEAAIEADPTVTAPSVLTDLPERRLYGLDFTDEAMQVGTFPTWSEHDIVIRRSTGTAEGWEVRWAIPTREALADLREEYRRRDVPFQLLAIYEREDGTALDDDTVALTDPQHEALVTAFELGYYAVPRAAGLTDVAESLGVSEQAVSERLRRATANLIDTSIHLGS